MNNSFAIVAALLLTLGERARSFEMLIVGRFIIGVDSGKGLFEGMLSFSSVNRKCVKNE